MAPGFPSESPGLDVVKNGRREVIVELGIEGSEGIMETLGNTGNPLSGSALAFQTPDRAIRSHFFNDYDFLVYSYPFSFSWFWKRRV